MSTSTDRFVARLVPQPGRPRNWRVYDTVAASFPYDREDIGHVRQDVTQAEAKAEADRLNHPDARPKPSSPALSEWDVEF